METLLQDGALHVALPDRHKRKRQLSDNNTVFHWILSVHFSLGEGLFRSKRVHASISPKYGLKLTHSNRSKPSGSLPILSREQPAPKMKNGKDVVAIVIDNGSDTSKAGCAGQAAPSVVLTTVVGRHIQRFACHFEPTPEYYNGYVGGEAIAKFTVMRFGYPIEHGVVTNWDDMERMWQYTFIAKCVSHQKNTLCF